MVRAVLFDLDGTLIDSVPLLLRAYRNVTTALRGTPLPDEWFLRGIGTPLRRQLAEIARDPDEAEAMRTGFLAYFREHHDEAMAYFPGAAEVVRSLHGRGVPLAIVTSNGRAGTVRGLDLLGVTDLLPVLVCGDDVEHPKPHPQPVRMALAALGVSAGNAVFVGDSTHDLAAGRAAGVRTAAALWGPRSREQLAPYAPDFWLNDPRDVLALVDG